MDAAQGVLANDSDGDPSDTLTAFVVTSPTQGNLILQPDGSFSFSIDSTFQSTVTFTYHAWDGLTFGPTVAATLTVGNTPPVAMDDNFILHAGNVPHTYSPDQGLLINDFDPDVGQTLSASVTALPLHGTLVLNVDGSFTYTPIAQFTGDDTFTYVDTDGITNSAPATVTLSVMNEPPIAQSDVYQVHGATLTTTAASTACCRTTPTRADGDSLSAVLTAPADARHDPVFAGRVIPLHADGFLRRHRFFRLSCDRRDG